VGTTAAAAANDDDGDDDDDEWLLLVLSPPLPPASSDGQAAKEGLLGSSIFLPSFIIEENGKVLETKSKPRGTLGWGRTGESSPCWFELFAILTSALAIQKGRRAFTQRIFSK
jgi:hypothetical protein